MICIKCNLPKDAGQCKNCKKMYMKGYVQKNKEKLSVSQKEWYKNNSERVIKKSLEYYENNKSDLVLKRKLYNENHKINRNAWEKKRKLSDPAYKLRKNFSTKICVALKGNKNNLSILSYLPYTMKKLREHLESQFDDKMSWANYGIYWHVDHIIPQSKLLYTSMMDDNFKKCWSLENLRPLEAIENIRKSNKIIGDK